ncbi:GrpB family protein [Microbacterium sp.]|uniref:GrpB family protein n=1 Tax=Microbacterium sp. TaxID=51671 RepID=UPI0033400BB3
MLLAEHDPQWAAEFRVVADDLRRIGDPSWTIEHIGSTAVPGIRVKPVIDIAVRCDAVRLDTHLPALEEAGWRRGSGVRTHPVLIREQAGLRRHIAHFFAPEDWENAHQRGFRDGLRSHPDDARRYERVKIGAAASAPDRSYTDAKSAVVQEVMGRARRARGLPPVVVHDEA